MLIQVELENIASFRDLTRLSLVNSNTSYFDYRPNHIEPIMTGSLDLPLLNMAIIFGANASGKSNLLEIVDLLQDILVNDGLVSQIKPFIFDERTKDEKSYIELSLLVDSHIYRYGLVVKQAVVIEEWLVNEVIGQDDNDMLFYRQLGNEIKHQLKSKQIEDLKLNDNQTFLGLLFENDIEDVADIKNWFKNKIVKFSEAEKYFFDQQQYQKVFSKYHDIFIDILRLADPAIIDFQVNFSKNEYEIKRQYFDKNGDMRVNEGWLPFDQYASAGTGQMLSTITLLLDALEHNKLLIIDEWDNHLHHLVAQYLLLYLQENRSQAQFILSSHDLLLLNSEVLQPDQIWFVEKSRTGISELFSMSEFKNIEGHFKRNQIMQEYLNGRYGAIPYVNPIDSIKHRLGEGRGGRIGE